MKWIVLASALFISAICSADQSVYSDQLDNGWQNWSWASVDFTSTAYVHSGTHSIAVAETGTNQAIYLHCNDQTTGSFEGIQFWINGGATGGQTLQVQGLLDGNAGIGYTLPSLKANTWQKVIVPLAGVGAGSVANFSGFWIQDVSGQIEANWYLDDISLVAMPKNTASQPIYIDAMQNNWSQSGTATTNLSNTSTTRSGKYSISVTATKANQLVAFSHLQQDGSLYKAISFWINGGSQGGQQLQVNATASGTTQATYNLPPLLKNTWQQIAIPLQLLGVDERGDVDGFVITDRSGTVQPTYFLDDITLSATPAVGTLTTITINIAKSAPISPYIYGINSTDFAGMGPGFTLCRQGGNRLTAYNWETNASNAGSDYYYQNDGLMGDTNQPGWAGQTFIAAATAGGAVSLLTVPIVDYVAADKLGGGDIRNTTDYVHVRLKENLPIKPGGNYTYNPDTTDYYVYEDEFVNFIKQFSTPQLPIFFCLDNEPDLWSSTHPEVHPTPVTYAEMVTRTTSYATQIKKVYPGATLFGPVSYGWAGYRNLQGASDANGRDFLTFFLQGMASANKTAGKRLLDVLDLHWYPEATGDGIRIVNEGDSDGLADARIQASRSLWDPTYVENSWITTYSTNGAGIDLIPNTMGLIKNNYPGTKLSFSEYNYGGGNSISGAIAQADVLGVFGRYGVYAAANWGIDSNEAAEVAGFQSFINYDRKGSKFGDRELSVSGEKPALNSVFAALDSKNSKRLTLVVINKSFESTPFNIDFPRFLIRSTKAFQVTAGNYAAPANVSIMNFTDGVSLLAPPYSITTIEVLGR